MLAETYRRRLFDHALDHYGFVTTGDAAKLGVPAVELRKIARRGGVRHVAYGLYRFEDVPPTPEDEFMEAVLRVGPGAYLTGDAVLDLHGLGLVNPRRIRVGTAKRARPKLPARIEVVRAALPPEDMTTYEGIPSATVARALRDCRHTIMGERLIDAVREAERRGLVRRREARALLAELGVAA